MKQKGQTNEEQIRRIEDFIQHGQTLDVSKLRHFLLNGADVPLYCVGSGGFGLSMKLCALLYSANKGMAQACTPLLMNHVSDPTLKTCKVLFYSKGGSQVDTGWLFKRMAALNPQGIFGLGAFNPTSKHANTMINDIREISENWCLFNLKKNKETFVSTASHLTMTTAIYRAFTNDDNPLQRLTLSVDHNYTYVNRDGSTHSLPALKDIKTYIALFGGWGEPVAASFESIMTEAGLANVQICDLRNWCHGRFIFLSNHIEDSVLLLYLTPREKEYAMRLLNETGIYDKNKSIFPNNVHIITIETEYDEPLATLDLAIKNIMLLNDIANSYGVDIENPINKSGIDKRFPRRFKMKEQKEFGSVNLDFGRTGTLKGVSRKRLIQYNPKLSIEKIAKKNGVSEAAVQAYIRDNHIDRKRDNQLILYKKVKNLQYENPELTAVEISKKLNCAYNTIRRYMNMDKFDVPVKKGHVSLVHNDVDK